MSVSPEIMWKDYFKNLGTGQIPELDSDMFCDNEKDANELAQLVLAGIKRATASAGWTLEKTRSKSRQVGQHWVVKDWEGNAVCIVRTTKVTVLPFNEVTEDHAVLEGEGDKSLSYWRDVHRGFFEREFALLRLRFSEAMPIVFEEFEVVYP